MSDIYENRHGWVWPRADVGAWAAVFFTLGDLDAAVRLCKKRDTVVQAGGNCGVWPKHLAAQFKKVLTFEPYWVNYKALEQNLKDCTNVKHYYAALGERDDDCIIKEHSPDNYGAKYIEPLNGETYVMSDQVPVPIVPIDSFGLTGLDLLVLDVEGYETAALRGARDSILRHRPVIMFEDKHAERYGFQKPEDYLTSLNYRVVDRRHRDVIMQWDGAGV